MTKARCFVGGAAVASVGFAVLAGPALADPPFILRKDDPGIAKAGVEARRTLPIFFGKFDQHAPGTSRFRVNVDLPTDDGRGIESLWVEVLAHRGDEVAGRVLDEPEFVKGLHAGSPIRVKLSKVGDWTYQRGGKAYGYFTLRYLVAFASPAQKAEARRTFAPTPLEPGAH